MTCSALHKNSGYRVRDSMKSIDDFLGGGVFSLSRMPNRYVMQ